MTHKRYPAGCALVLAASARLPGLVSTFLTAMVQEHERGVGGWHAEWPVIAAAVQTTGVAAATLADVVQGLEIDTARIDRKSTRLNSSHLVISYAVFCLKKKKAT